MKQEPKTGLFRHAWDESRSMFWCDPETGLSEHAWGRAVGWYTVALVEVLDYLPKSHPGHATLVKQLNYLLEVLPKAIEQAKKTNEENFGLSNPLY